MGIAIRGHSEFQAHAVQLQSKCRTLFGRESFSAQIKQRAMHMRLLKVGVQNLNGESETTDNQNQLLTTLRPADVARLLGGNIMQSWSPVLVPEDFCDALVEAVAALFPDRSISGVCRCR